MFHRTIGVIAFLSLPLVQPALAQTPPTAKDHATAIKTSLQQSLVALRQYQWVETTAISIKGEQKSSSQATCYYGVDGKVQKTPVAAAPADNKRGLRGKIAENKKEEISDAAKEAVALVKQYIPPDPDKISAAKAAGKLSVTMPDAQGNVKLTIADYLKAGDSLAITANAVSDKISGVSVSTFTDKAKDAVALNVKFGAFPDGTVYPEKINLNVKSQELGVAIENTGYRKAAN